MRPGFSALGDGGIRFHTECAVPGVGNRQQVLYVGTGRELSCPSQAARVARDGVLLEIVAYKYKGNVTPLRVEGQVN